jgi:hypothetical protein
MLERLKNDYDWDYIFYEYGYPSKVESAICDTSTIKKEDVIEIFEADDGMNDGPSWMMAGKLKDGRCFYIEASCDYTGWG